MNIVVSTQIDKPIYEQIYEQIMAMILNGSISANTCLPSIRAIAKELNISVITVKKAYEMLETNGFIYTRAGIGCFISELSVKKLDDKKLLIAKNQIAKDFKFYKNLQITETELIELIKQEYKKI